MKRIVELSDPTNLFVYFPEGIRAGVIPYAIVEGEIYWLMGNNKYNRWSDFGGGCKISKRETPYSCLIREATEETNGLLTEAIKSSIEKGEGLYFWAARSKKGVVVDHLLFVPIQYQEHLPELKDNPEIDHLLWVPQRLILSPTFDLRLVHRPLNRYLLSFRTESPIRL